MEFGSDHHQHHHHHHRDEDEEDEEEEAGSEEMLMTMNNNNNDNINIGGTNPNNNHHNINNSSSLKRMKMVEALSQVQIHQPPAPPPASISSNGITTTKPRYRECLRNHAINVMGHGLDGCGDFMPGGPEGSVEALKCAACSCHRNFHRKEDPSDHHHTAVIYSHSSHLPFGSYYRTSSTNTTAPSGYLHLDPPPQQPRPLALPSASGGGGGSQSRGEEDVSDPADVVHHHNGVGGSGMSMMMMKSNGAGKKRFRTKFTAEQKERMLRMAERIGWRIQKCDEDLVQQFCHDTNVKRHVFKVWMHNNKLTLGKQSATTSSNQQQSQHHQ